jgi:capsular exopolysaccharide synthesis family protein
MTLKTTTKTMGNAAREELAKMVQRLFITPTLQQPTVVVFSSVDPGAGTSYICAHLAETLSTQIKGSICIIDGNLRRPALHSFWNLSGTNGLAEAVEQGEPLMKHVKPTPLSNLFFLAAGTAPADLHPVLTSDALKDGIAELRQRYQHILIDTPPLLKYADAALWGSLSDGAVLIIEANATHREAARKAKETLESAKISLLGVVFNKRTFPIPAALYSKL